MKTRFETISKVVAVAAVLLSTSACAGGQGMGFLPTSSAYTINQDEITIRAILTAQDDAWNRGDIEGFMEGYWVSDELRFASGGEVTRGYDATLARYKARYSDRAKMGTLSFSDLEVEPMGRGAAVVHGSWLLEREGDDPSGLFTLVFRRIDGEWVIVSDTTTSAD